MSITQKEIAFFDFDGTITSSDSLKHFILWYFNWPNLVYKTLIFSPYYIYHKVIKKDNSRAKEKLFEVFFRGTKADLFNEKCSEFAKTIIPQLFKKEAQKRLEWHLNRGDEVVVVSASIENYLNPSFDNNSVNVIGTMLEVVEGRISGNFKGKNCFGVEKEIRIKEKYDLRKFSAIYAYGDSIGDKEMLGLANKSFYRKLS